VGQPSSAELDRTGELGLAEFVPVKLGSRIATMPWQLDMGSLRRVTMDVAHRVRPRAVILWPGAEFLAFETKFPVTLADRIDCAALSHWRDVRARSGWLDRFRAVRAAAHAARYERHVVRSVDATIVVGHSDAAVLRWISGRASVHVVPNGVTLWPPAAVDSEGPIPTVVFTGVMSFEPNVNAALFFADEVWPLIRRSVPAARFVVAGREPAREVRLLANRPGIEVLPDVGSMDAVLREAWVAVAPMRSGGGIKNKVLEAWSCERPVVMSTLATNGLTLDADAQNLVTDEPEGFAKCVIHLLNDPVERRRLGRVGHSLAVAHHAWGRSAAAISELLDRQLRIAAPERPLTPARPRLRLAVLVNLAPRKLGSLEGWLVGLARAAIIRGHVLDVFTHEPAHPSFLAALKEAGGSWASLAQLEHRPLEGIRTLRSYDVVQLNLFGARSEAALLAYAAWPTRVLLVEQTSDYGVPEPDLARRAKRSVLNPLTVPRLWGMAGISDYVRGRTARYLGLDDRRSVTLYYGVDLDRFVWAPRPADAPGPPTIVVVAHLIPEKGVDHLLRAFARLDQPDARLVVVGDGPQASELRALAASLGVGARTDFVGLRDDVQTFLQQADVFVHPAVWAEAFGWTIAEAMATGCPVVASRTGGIPELIEDEETGLLVEPGNPDVIASALRRLLASPELRRRLAVAARERVEERFSLAKCAAQHVDWCERAAASRRDGRSREQPD
jgi:glycosyltransferase involved in cell wall biosynthesis